MTALTKQMEEKEKTKAEEECKGWRKFLAENKKKERRQDHGQRSAIQVIKEGTGPQPKQPTQWWQTIEERLVNGTEFDSLQARSACNFSAHRCFKGWTEGLQLMKSDRNTTVVLRIWPTADRR